MVAGKHLRALGGSAELERDAAGHLVVALDLPSQIRRAEAETAADSAPNLAPALNVVVAEDCDDTFPLTEVMLPHQNPPRAPDGREALPMLQKHRFACPLLD